MSSPLDRKAQSTRRAERTEETRQRIIEASLELFMKQGYDKTTTRQILQRVGILNGSLYNIYRSKEDIFSDIVGTVVAETLRLADERLPADSPLCTRLCFPMCIQIYASSRSDRIAELLVIAHEKWEIRKKVTNQILSWAAVGDVGEGFGIRMEMCTSAIGGMVERICREPGSLDEADALLATVEMMSGALNLPCDDVAGTVESLVEAFRADDMTICGIRI